MENNIVKITPAELLQNLLGLDDGEKLDFGAYDDTYGDVCKWHSATNISSTMQDACQDTAPTYLIGYYGGYASAIVYAYDIEDHKGSVKRLAAILRKETLLDANGKVCMEVPSEE